MSKLPKFTITMQVLLLISWAKNFVSCRRLEVHVNVATRLKRKTWKEFPISFPWGLHLRDIGMPQAIEKSQLKKIGKLKIFIKGKAPSEVA